jgi:VIT1/CCC1 family predicted Fe2+/Mn2+ transporter
MPAFLDAPALRARIVDANDGIVATAGILEGFVGAGATDAALVLAASALTIAGALALGGMKWAEAAGDRDAHLALAAEEADQLARNPDDELAELTAYWTGKGLSSDVAAQVALQLSARDALAAQLEFEHGIREIPRFRSTVVEGIGAAIAFMTGSVIPLLVAILAPGAIEGWVIVVAVVVSLTVTSYVAARSGSLSLVRTLLRSLAVGVGTVAVGYLAGAILF